MKKKTSSRFAWSWVAAWVFVVVLAAVMRIYQLASVPNGLHQDEAWFAYNAFLLKTHGMNIYGEKWPLSVDMWGDHVSAIHSYLIVPFITLFGVNYAAFRGAIVSMSLLTLGTASWVMYRLTRNRWIAWLFGLMFALSPWNIIMSRASSTVVIDTFLLTVLMALFLWGAPKIAALPEKLKIWKFADAMQWLSWTAGMYAITVAAYFTYFTSRLVIPGLLVLLAIWAVGQKLNKKFVLASLAIVTILYLVFPFGVMLKTPYALGRFQQTTILESDYVKNHTFNDIARAGQSHVPVLLTRALYNKVTENTYHTLQQYLAFFSPSVMMFKTAPPVRYFVPNTGVVTWYEYLGFVLAVGYLMYGWRKSNDDPQAAYWWANFLCLGILALSLVPTALTIDDFPNFQRGVMATPFWQMVAAVGWFTTLAPVIQEISQKRKRAPWVVSLLQQHLSVFLGAALTIILLAQVVPFSVAYFGQSIHTNHFARSRSGEELAKWLLSTAPNATIFMDQDEANFIYPYLYSQQSILNLPVRSSEKHLLLAKEFQIGSRYYFTELCSLPDLHRKLEGIQPQYVIAKTYPPPDSRCILPKEYQHVKDITYDDGTIGYEIFERQSK